MALGLEARAGQATATGYGWVKYILKSANTWSGPIRSFGLSIRKSEPSEDVSTCFDGLKKVDMRTFRATLTDFVPKDDLQVLFF